MTHISGSWITNPATQAVCAAIAAEGAEVLFVGGCVRNTLLLEPVRDIDIATSATPNTVVRLAGKAGIKAVPTGIGHGTVTLVEGGIPHEVTTFRKDVSTDGRRAVVAYAIDVRDDAARRDFTMNALYARADGTLLDPLGGLPDLRARRVRFIGDARDRIREDYLRSLRYFRFFAWYGDQAAGIDPKAMAAIAENLDGLGGLSRERVGAELLKLLAAPDPAPAMAAMRSSGALGQLLPGADDRGLAPLVQFEQQAGAEPNGLRRLAVLGNADGADKLRLSKAQRNQLNQIQDAASGLAGAAEMGYRLGRERAVDAMLLRCALQESPWKPVVLHEIAQGAAAKLPVTAKDLMPALRGPKLGAAIARLEDRWIASGFAMSREDLLADYR